jgi:response regulator RpfG family c-di-GMP phosphodiesterase
MNTQPKSTILFVDDEPFVLDAVRRIFANDDLNLLFAADGGEALALLERATVQVVVSDFRMPGMTGGQLLHTVSERWPDTVRIILSGYADMTSVVSSINDGQIYKFIAKPWRNAELLEVVRTGVEKYWQQLELRSLAEATLAQSDSLLREHFDGLQRIGERQDAMEQNIEVLAAYQLAFESDAVSTLLFHHAEYVDANAAARAVLSMDQQDGKASTHPLVQHLARQLADEMTLGLTPASALQFCMSDGNMVEVQLAHGTDAHGRSVTVARVLSTS